MDGCVGSWVFPPSATGETIKAFLARYVFFCAPGNIGLLVNSKPLGPTDSHNSLGLGPGPIKLHVTLKKRDDRRIYFRYLYTRPNPPRLMEDVCYNIGCPATLTASGVYRQLAALMGIPEGSVKVCEIEGRVLNGSEKLSTWAHKALAFSGSPPPVSDTPADADLENWKYPTLALEKVKDLGQGAAGVVRLMRDPATGVQVAVKTFKPNAAGSDDSFNRELWNLIRFNHPCIQSVLGWYAVAPSRFIVTEYLEHGSLEGVLAGDPPAFFDDTGAAIVCIGIVLGLRFLHSRGIVHRDIKPLNILIDHRGYAQIADFGLTRRIDLDMTLDGIGSLEYRAPELFTSESDVDYTETVDVYALTLVLYRVITGLPLFPGLKSDQIITLVGKGDHPKIPPSVSPEIRALFEAGWAHSPNRLSCDDIFVELRQLGYRIRPNVDTEKVEKFVECVLSLELACL
jgi:hypothetical protein